MSIPTLKALLVQKDPQFWTELRTECQTAANLDQLLFLSTLARRAKGGMLPCPPSAALPLRIAILGGFSLYPLHEVFTLLLEAAGIPLELFLGDYDNYVAEIVEADSRLYEFRPNVVILFPSKRLAQYTGTLTDPNPVVQAAATAAAAQLVELAKTAHDRTQAEIILANFPLPARCDLGAFRAKTLASPWNFRKCINWELGSSSPSYLHICDLEFLASRHGTQQSEDPRAWYESKQPFSRHLLPIVCRELVHLVQHLRIPPKKVLVLDLDNTLWGGVLAEDGMEGIEIGDTSPRGEAFKAFQRFVGTLKDRGVLLAISSKNDMEPVLQALTRHPEMVLRPKDFVSIKANWDPKSDNLRTIAAELNLGLDSMVFVDDNPAEVEIVRQFTPEVHAIVLDPDPANFIHQLQDSRQFEPKLITAEDAIRTRQYLAEQDRKQLQSGLADMSAYLASLEMTATVSAFTHEDVPRLAQLINKSNQFNLTTRRRTPGEVEALIGSPEYETLSVRLSDRFGEHGLISIAIGRVLGEVMELDTWLMSCRVLKRQVEDLVLDQLARLAQARGCTSLLGVYIPTSKNEMVRDFFSAMGFRRAAPHAERQEYVLELDSYVKRPTHIQVSEFIPSYLTTHS